ncbi:MAG: heme-binding domain-containing protein [Anaerolineae bacterium]|nr:heme-binding domain-containing protein [Anaerolineae bacterium]
MIANNETQSAPRLTARRIVIYGAGLLIGVVVLMQFVRFIIPEFRIDNPEVTNTINWDSPETERLWNTACADCHSNQTVYPWYSYIAPVGWLVAHDVQEGRDALNVSTNHRVNSHEMVEKIQEGEMPLPIYTTMHPDAKLSNAEKQTLMDGLRATFARTSGTSTRDDDDD